MSTLYGDGSLRACIRYSLSFSNEIVQRTPIHLEDNKDRTSIWINCLEYVTIIINYFAVITALLDSAISNDPHSVVLCVKDNVSAKKLTINTFKSPSLGELWQGSFGDS
jgi:hypothetical protein